MRRTSALIVAVLVATLAGAHAATAQDAQARDLCLKVEAAEGTPLVEPSAVAQAIASGEITLVDVVDCEDRTTGSGGGRATGNRFGAWFVSDLGDEPISGSTIAIAGVEASSGSFVSGQPPPQLSVRCAAGDVDLLITWYDTLEVEQPIVETQTEALALEARPWNRSTDQTATFYPGQLLRPFMESLYGQRTLAARTYRPGKTPLTAIFDIEGIEDALVNVRTACEWE